MTGRIEPRMTSRGRIYSGKIPGNRLSNAGEDLSLADWEPARLTRRGICKRGGCNNHRLEWADGTCKFSHSRLLQPAASPVGHQGRFAELVRRRRRLLLRVQRLLLRRGSKITGKKFQSLHRRSRSCRHDRNLTNLRARRTSPPPRRPRATSRARTPRARCVLSQRCFI